MIDRKNSSSQTMLARLIGLLLLLSFILGVYQLSTHDGALSAAAPEGVEAVRAALQQNMMMDAAGGVLAILVAIGFYFLLRSVNGPLIILSTLARLVGVAIGLYGVYAAYQLGLALKGQSIDTQIEQYEVLNFDLFHWGLIAASIGATITFALLFAGRMIPRLLAGYGVIASIAVVIGAGAIYFAPWLSDIMYPGYAAGNALAFVSLTLWLLIAGVKTQQD